MQLCWLMLKSGTVSMVVFFWLSSSISAAYPGQNLYIDGLVQVQLAMSLGKSDLLDILVGFTSHICISVPARVKLA